jgi:hypothetical protein
MKDTATETTARHVTRIVVAPLRKGVNVFTTAEDAMSFLNDRTPLEVSGELDQYEVRIEFSNGDKIEATYNSKARVQGFIEFFAK